MNVIRWRLALAGSLVASALFGAGSKALPAAPPPVAFAAPEGAIADSAAESSLFVRFRPGLEAAGVMRLQSLGAGEAVAVAGTAFWLVATGDLSPAEAGSRWSAVGEIAEVVPNYVRGVAASPNDPYYATQAPYLETIRAAAAWDRTTGSDDVVVAVVDSGVDLDHPDLAGRLLDGFDAVDGGQPQDENGHGTMVAGIIGAVGDNDRGVAGMVGRGKILPVRVLDEHGRGDDDDLVRGIVWATDHGADVISVSIAGPDQSAVVKAAVDYALANDVVVVAAAGNRGRHEPTYPAALPGVVAVTATDASGMAASFSNHGDWVDLAAPGMGIISTAMSDDPKGTYAIGEGTSYAAPIVAGVAALLRGQDPTADARAVASRLRAAAQDRGPHGIDVYYGAGVVDAFAAIGGPVAAPTLGWERDGQEPDEVADRGGVLALGSMATATISPEGDVDWFAVDVPEPASLSITVTPPAVVEGRARQMDADVAVYDGELRRLGQSAGRLAGAAETVTVEAHRAGRYWVSVANELGSAGPGSYTIVATAGHRVPRYAVGYDREAEGVRTVALADVTGDGHLGIVSRSTYDDLRTLVVTELNGDGEPAGQERFDLGSTTPGVTALAAGDIDRDGDTDLIAPTGTGLYLVRQDDGRLQSPVALGWAANDAALADIDADGRLDIVIENGAVRWLRNTGAGWEERLAHPDPLEDLDVADVTGDGRADIVGVRCPVTCSGFAVLAAEPAGGFTRHVYQADSRYLAVGDVTGDGRADVLISAEGGLEVLAQTAGGQLGSATKVPLGRRVSPALVGDMNGDGRNDVVAPYDGRGFGIVYGRPGGGFSDLHAVSLPDSLDPDGGVATGDVNNDGDVDVVTGGGFGPVVARQVAPATEPGPWVRDTEPAEHTAGVTSGVQPRFRLSRPIDPDSLTKLEVRLTHGHTGTTITAAIGWDPATTTLTVRPSAPLSPGPWLVTAAGDVTDHHGDGLAEPLRLRFTVGPLPTTPEAPPAPREPPTTRPAGPSGPTARAPGYWMLDATGHVYAFGSATRLGAPTLAGGARAADLEPRPADTGYWIVDDTGRVHAYDAPHFGNADPSRLARGEKVASLSATPDGDGYWLFTNRGRVLPFGAARSFGDMSAVSLNGPVLDSIATPTGQGYYMVAADGGVFTFGDAVFLGSMGAARLNAPVQSLVPHPTGHGYWLVASDGGVFAFNAPFRGSMGAARLNRPITGMVPYGDGYLMLGEDGGAFNFSNLAFLGSLGADPPSDPVVAVAAR